MRLYGVGVFYINIDKLAIIIFLFLIDIDNCQNSLVKFRIYKSYKRYTSFKITNYIRIET